jgi:fibronectin type 3 domain-containing protein
VASSGKPKITWNKVDGATKYKVYRSTDGGATYSLLRTTSGTSLTNSSTTAGNKYYYYVIAVNANGVESGKSNVVTRICDLPAPTVKISVVSSTGKLKLTWDKVTGAKDYSVYRSTDGGATYSLLKTTTGTSLTNTSITAGNMYYYKVKANHTNSSANSAYSSVVKGTCDLPRPTASVALNSSGKPVITWEKVSGATKYTVYIYDADGNLLKTSSTTGTKLTHSSAVKGTTYKYQVVAVHSNSAANSAKYTAVSIKCTK